MVKADSWQGRLLVRIPPASTSLECAGTGEVTYVSLRLQHTAVNG